MGAVVLVSQIVIVVTKQLKIAHKKPWAGLASLALYGGVICRIAMKPKLVSKPLVAGLVLLLVGGVFVWLENTFYQYLDEDGVLHESMFLPLGALFILIGIVMLFFAAAGTIIAAIRQRKS